MKPRILGYAVLVYAALTSLSLLSFSLGASTIGWWMLDVMLWIAYVSGGFGLILDRPWSRLVLLITSATSVGSSMICLLVLLISRLENYSMFPISIVTGVLPELVIFFVALRLPSPKDHGLPESPASVATIAHSRRVDIAYGCFAWIAGVLCTILLLSLFPPDITTTQVLVWVLGFPIAMATIVAGVVSVVISVVQWKKRSLLVMSVITVSLPFVLLAAEEWKIIGKRVALAWYIASTVVLVFLCIRWFMFVRRRTSQNRQTRVTS